MSVSNAETFKISHGAVKGNYAEMILELGRFGVTATRSGEVLTLTNSELAGADGAAKFGRVLRYCRSAGAKFTYTAAS